MIQKLLKAIVIGGIWTILYFLLTRFLFTHFAGWDYLSPTDWQRIEYRWEAGATIKSARDYSILFALLMLVPLWFYGWKYLYQLNYMNIMLWPFNKLNTIMLRRYQAKNKRIILRNIGTSIKVEEEIKLKTAAIKPEERNEANKIRQAVNKKLKETQIINDN